MNTKSDAISKAYRLMHIWERIGIACVLIMIGLMLYVLSLQVQLANCYAG